MYKVFCGWGGNQPLAYEIKAYLKDKNFDVVVGGGSPTGLHIGTQVIGQINECDCAILLVEEHDGVLSPNLFFEWGYIIARMKVTDIHVYMINKSVRELPSDLLGVWATEISRTESGENGDRDLAQRICERFLKDSVKNSNKNYFDIIDGWRYIRQTFEKEELRTSERHRRENIVLGCLAAYYYNDIEYFNTRLARMSATAATGDAIRFAKAYNDVFLKSAIMSKPLPQTAFFECAQAFEGTLARKHGDGDTLDFITDILCCDAYGLAYLLFLKNDDLDGEMTDICKEKALSYFRQTLSLTDDLERQCPEDKCLIQLIRAYIYNDIAHLYQQFFGDEESFLKYLDLSVDARDKLRTAYASVYPENAYLITKFEQEYMIALSEKCIYMKDPFMRKMNIATIKAKYNEWKDDITYMSSLVTRIENNLKKLD